MSYAYKSTWMSYTYSIKLYPKLSNIYLYYFIKYNIYFYYIVYTSNLEVLCIHVYILMQINVTCKLSNL